MTLSKAIAPGANLAGADLKGIDFRGMDLSGANLMGADLNCADLDGADLDGANLSGANLMGAVLAGASLINANLTGASLYSSDLRGANLADADLTGVDLSRATFDASTGFLGVKGLSSMAEERDECERILNIIESGNGHIYMPNWHTCKTTHCLAGWVAPDVPVPDAIASRKLPSLVWLFYECEMLETDVLAELKKVISGETQIVR